MVTHSVDLCWDPGIAVSPDTGDLLKSPDIKASELQKIKGRAHMFILDSTAVKRDILASWDS